jgi:SAM-dependent methyltransferase
MPHFTHRKLSRENMDDPHASRAEIAEALRYLRFINRRMGGVAAALRQFKRWALSWKKSRTVRILDVGTGSADIPLAIAEWARKRHYSVNITGVDLHPITVELARAHVQQSSDIEIVQADALQLMNVFEPASFDYAHAGLFLHHLQDIEVLTVLRIMDRLTTRGMIWNDLVRWPLPKLWLWPFIMGAPSHVKHDAIVSVQAGFTKREAIDLATRADWKSPRYQRHLIHRFTIVSTKKPAVR